MLCTGRAPTLVNPVLFVLLLHFDTRLTNFERFYFSHEKQFSQKAIDCKILQAVICFDDPYSKHDPSES